LLLADRIVMMTNGPAATVGEIVTVPFTRPRERLSIVDDPLYLKTRARLIQFLEERADHGRATVAPAANALTSDELFVIEKYTGFNRFRKKYRTAHLPSGGDGAPAPAFDMAQPAFPLPRAGDD
jgi:hypothetical protein